MLLPKLPEFYVDEIIKRALAEDINYIDITTDLLIANDSISTAEFTMKEDGVLAGIDIAMHVFQLLDSRVELSYLNDGQFFKKGTEIAEIKGSTAAILKGERTALNILQHMSGIATYTKKCVDLVAGTYAAITDTRKTLAGLRALQKYAVLCGGGSNHRFNLSSAAMIKDNHIAALGSISKAVKTLRERAGHTITIEVEVRDLEQLQEAINAGADIIMLDNMSVDVMRHAVEAVRSSEKSFIPTNGELASKGILVEASGNITLDNIREVAETGIDIISIGALTHSVKALDISLRFG
jgi:nicotinate-nucleotide pyrophosphorylase (carboxylating)